MQTYPENLRSWLDVENWLKMRIGSTLLSRRRNNVEVTESTLVQRGEATLIDRRCLNVEKAMR